MSRSQSRRPRAFTSGVLLAVAVLALAVGVGVSRATSSDDGGGGGGGTAASAGQRVDVIVAGTDSAFWQTVFAGAARAGTDFGVDLGYFGPTSETGVAEQVQLVENAISRQVDAIVLAATSTTALNAAVRKARDAGIPVVTVGNGVDGETDGFVRTDDAEAGRQGGVRMCELLSDQGVSSGDIHVESSIAGSPTLQARDSGFAAGVAEDCPQVRVLETRYNDNDPARATSQVNDVLAANDRIVGIYADNNTSGVGAARAVQDNDAADRIPVVSFDADPAQATALRNGSIDVLIVQNPFFLGYQGVVEGVMARLGSIPPRTTAPSVTLIDRANMEEPVNAGLLDPPTRRAD